MARSKTGGKSVRIPQAALAAIEDLRSKMSRATHIGGIKLAPFGRLSDGTVIGFGVALAGYVMNEHFSVIDNRDFAEKLLVKLDPYLTGSTQDEKRALVSHCLAAASQVSGYDDEDQLRAAPPEGSVS